MTAFDPGGSNAANASVVEPGVWPASRQYAGGSDLWQRQSSGLPHSIVGLPWNHRSFAINDRKTADVGQVPRPPLPNRQLV